MGQSNSGDLAVGTAEGEGADENNMPEERELFSNLLGNHDESIAQVKKRKFEEKKKLVDKTT